MAAMNEMLQELQGFDLADLDFQNIGSWPAAVKLIAWVLVFAAVLAVGYFYNIAGLREELAHGEARELELKQEFEAKAFKAANLDALRKQMVEMEQSFGALVSQLPSDTEVPGLLEDITNKGLDSGLDIKSIQLQAEQAKEFYVELPISISVSGGYHDFGSFVSGIAGLPRIVTLHDFKIESAKEGSGLIMNIAAKTYRYKDA